MPLQSIVYSQSVSSATAPTNLLSVSEGILAAWSRSSGLSELSRRDAAGGLSWLSVPQAASSRARSRKTSLGLSFSAFPARAGRRRASPAASPAGPASFRSTLELPLPVSHVWVGSAHSPPPRSSHRSPCQLPACRSSCRSHPESQARGVSPTRCL